MASATGWPSRWFYVRLGGVLLGAHRQLPDAQALAAEHPGAVITEGVGTVCDPGGDPITERWR